MSKHSRDGVVIRNGDGDVIRMSGTITEASPTRPYVMPERPSTTPKHAKD